jgi:hypothetical protein
MSSRARPTRAWWAMIHRVGIRKLPDSDSSRLCPIEREPASSENRNLYGSGRRRTEVDATNRLTSGVFLRIVDRCERAVTSAAVRERYRELVWRALPRATVSERRDLRSGEVDSRAPDASLWHQSAGVPRRQRRERRGSDQRSRAVREIADHRPLSRRSRSVGNDGWRCGAGRCGSGGISTTRSKAAAIVFCGIFCRKLPPHASRQAPVWA